MQARRFARSALCVHPTGAVRRRCHDRCRRAARSGRPAPRAPSVNVKPEAQIPGKFIWFDCVTDNPYGSKAFYGVVFGWDFHSIGSGTGRYTLIENRGRNIGGLHFRPRSQGSAQGSRWISLMSVADPALAARYVEAHGGKVVVAPTVFEGRGTHALFRDDDGAFFGVLKSDTGDPPDGPAVAGRFPLARSFHARSEESGGVLSRSRRIRRQHQGDVATAR